MLVIICSLPIFAVYVFHFAIYISLFAVYHALLFLYLHISTLGRLDPKLLVPGPFRVPCHLALQLLVRFADFFGVPWAKMVHFLLEHVNQRDFVLVKVPFGRKKAVEKELGEVGDILEDSGGVEGRVAEDIKVVWLEAVGESHDV